MAIATGTAIAIAAGASAAGSVASAKMGSNAAKKAAETQAKSAREAQGMAGNIFQQQQQMQSPYMQLGGNAAGMLGRLTGSTGGARFASPPMGFGALGGNGVMPGLPPPPGQVPPGVAPMGPPSGYTGGPPMGPPNPRDPRQRHLSQFGGA